MYIIVGLGNPGREYEGTRHNVGFLVLDKLAAKENISILEKKHKAIIGKGMAAGQKCVLAKPQTYMNLSGECVRQLIDFYKVDETAELIVISDDVGEKPAGWDLVDYVLGRFSPKDREAMDEAAARAADAIWSIIAEGPDAAMNQFNTVKKPAKDPKKSKELKKQGEPEQEARKPEEPASPGEPAAGAKCRDMGA